MSLKVFVAGATGVIGAPLVLRLVAKGYRVFGMSRSPSKTEALRAAGAEPVIANVFEAAAVQRAFSVLRPEASSISSPICRLGSSRA